MALRIDFLSPDPYHYRYRGRRPRGREPAAFSLSTDGQFLFNLNAVDSLGLRPGLRLQLGPDQQDPRCWYLRVSPHEGFSFSAGKRWCFRSIVLRQALLNTLPHAPCNQTLRFRLDEMPVSGPNHEPLWPLLTAPYWQPAPAAAEQVTLAQPVERGAVGLRAVKYFAGQLL